MSKELLEKLNGRNKGPFKEWIDNFKGEPRIAWYPSAGNDFLDLFYLNPMYSKKYPGSKPDPIAPDIFLHTDYKASALNNFLKGAEFRIDDQAIGRVKTVEELPGCKLPLDSRILNKPVRGQLTGKVLFLEIYINSLVLGSFISPVIYVFAENTAFCAEKILPLQGIIKHVIHVRYGDGFGGGRKSSSIWLLNVLKKVKCEVYVTDNRYHLENGVDYIYRKYPDLITEGKLPRLKKYRVIPAESWSGYGDVSWNLLSSKKEVI